MKFPFSMEDAKRALGQIPEAMKENLGNSEPQAEKEATGQMERNMKSTNPSQIANRTASLIANTIDLKGDQVAGLALIIQAAIDESAKPLRDALTETRIVLDLIVAEWNSDVRSTQCFDSRIITNSRLALQKADSVL